MQFWRQGLKLQDCLFCCLRAILKSSMPRNSSPRQPHGPSQPPEQARVDLLRSVERGNKLLREHPLVEERYRVWRTNAWDILKAAFGERSGHLNNFTGKSRKSLNDETERRRRLSQQIAFLEAVIEEFPSVDQTQRTGSVFLSDLDTHIRRVSESLFKNGHYADSVSAAFKELNHQVKQEYKRRRNVELDGADLMHTAFSKNNPTFVLADQSTESGKNIQQGFMELFAGSMIGIRNPHAHENLSLDHDGAKHFLYLASLLMKEFKTVR